MNAVGTQSRSLSRLSSLVMDENKVTDFAVPPGSKP